MALSWLCGAADLRCARGLVARASSRACVPNLRTGAVAGAWCLPCRERPSERADLSAIASAPSWTCTGHAVHGCASMRSFCRARAPSWAPSGPVLAMLRACPRFVARNLSRVGAVAGASPRRCREHCRERAVLARHWPLLPARVGYLLRSWAPSRACCLRRVLAMRRASALGLSLGGRGESDRRVIVADPHRGHVTLENLLREGGVARCY